jgi:hypothetical protein
MDGASRSSKAQLYMPGVTSDFHRLRLVPTATDRPFNNVCVQSFKRAVPSCAGHKE